MKRLYVHNELEWQNLCSRNYFDDKTPLVTTLINGIVLPPKLRDPTRGYYSGGVCDQSFKFIAGFIRRSADYGGYYTVNQSYKVPTDQLEQRDESVIFGGVLVGHFGHFILEGMSRLWYIIENLKSNKKKIVFVTVLQKCDWFYDFFDLLGIDRNRIEFIEKPTLFKEIEIPEETIHSFDPALSFKSGYNLIYKTIRDNVIPGKIKKIFLTRTQLRKNPTLCVNEEYFESFYAKLGYTIVSPEKLSIYDQISLISGADEIVSIMGSLTHFALFCKPATKFVMLTRTRNDTLLPQCIVNQISGVDWKIVDVSLNFLYGNRATGVNLIGSTTCWKDFVLDQYGITLQEEPCSGSACFTYIKKWCYFYTYSTRIRKLESLTPRELLKYTYDSASVAYPESDDVSFSNNLGKKLTISDFSSEISLLIKQPLFLYQVHRSFDGWLKPSLNGVVNGNTKNSRQIEAVRIHFLANGVDIKYSVLSGNRWLHESNDSELSGSIGKSIPIKGIYMKVASNSLSISYRVYLVKGGGVPGVMMAINWNLRMTQQVPFKLNCEENSISDQFSLNWSNTVAFV